MKIVFDARMYGMENGGIGRYIVNLLDELGAQDEQNYYTLLLRRNHFNSLKMPGPRWSKVLVDARHYSVKEQIAVLRALNSLSPDLVHFPHFNVPLLYKGKYVVTIHDLLMHKRTGRAATTLPYFAYLVKRAGYKTIFKKAIQGSSAIIAPTNFVKGEIVKQFPAAKQKTKVVYEGLDQRAARPEGAQGLLASLKVKKPYFLYVGSVYPHKNIPRLVEAIATLNEKGHAAQLVIVTPRNVFRHRLSQYIKLFGAEGCVQILGFMPDEKLSYLYKHATAFVYPSREEGFGLPGLEAMANKTPVLASDIPVFKEVYKDNAIYFNPLDFSSIERAMKNALELPKQKREILVKKACDFTGQYTWKKNAKETLEVYEEVQSSLSL